jgi:hypothetical protein
MLGWGESCRSFWLNSGEMTDWLGADGPLRDRIKAAWWRIGSSGRSNHDEFCITESIPRRTSVSSALEVGSTLIEESAADIVATRRVIDVSGDGPNNDGNPMREVHDRVIGQGIVVNGLPVMMTMPMATTPTWINITRPALRADEAPLSWSPTASRISAPPCGTS